MDVHWTSVHRFSRLLLLGALVAAVTTGAEAQAPAATGTIRGTVVDAQSGLPLDAVQLNITGTTLGSLTNNTGEFVFFRVAAGTVIVRAKRLGSAPAEQRAVVQANATATIEFRLTPAAINLSEIVITGTGGETEKRRLGASLATVSATDIIKSSAVHSLPELLQGRTAGVSMLPSGGTIGTGGNIRIRGLTSMTQSGDPVIYIDGVRIDASNNGPNVGGLSPSRLTDLVPEDIERIEIVKGAAATTLYGTQGANGVMQIFTKRGATGAARWTTEVETGFERLDASRMPGRLWTQFQGPTGYQAHDPREIIQNGYNQKYGLSLRGGLEAITYFFSANISSEAGSIAPWTNRLRRTNGRVNVNAVLSPTLSIGVNVGVTGSMLRIPDNDNALHGLYSQVVSGVPWTARPGWKWGERWGSWDINQTIENFQDVQRFVGGVTIDSRPFEHFAQKLVLGLDWISEGNTRYVPYGFQGSGIPFGQRSNQQRRNNALTIDYTTHFSSTFGARITSDLAAGVQGNFNHDYRTLASGQDFPAPGVTLVSSTAVKTSAETRLDEINGGVFFQESVGIDDKWFPAIGVRFDGNSAFGKSFPVQAYPKASVAYNISQEKFWPKDRIPTLKLRAAFGTAGRSPTQFSADQTYLAIAAENGLPAVTPGNVGNPNLGPERSQELELGFDAGVWGDRLGIEFTSYTQRTLNALVRKQYPPSNGFSTTQFTNIGEVANRGIELGLHALLISRAALQWNANFQISLQNNKIVSLGGTPRFSGGAGIQIVQGYPILGIWARGIKSWDPVKRTHVATDTLIYRGSAAPANRGSLSSSVHFLRKWTFSAMLDYVTGMKTQNFAKGWSISKLTGDVYLATTIRPRGTPTPASDSLVNLIAVMGPGYFIEDASYLKLRELSLSYRLPTLRLGGLVVRESTLRLAGRNLWLYAPGFTNPDPEVNTNGNANFARGSDFNTQPQARRFTLTLSSNF